MQTFSIHCWSDETDEINHAPYGSIQDSDWAYGAIISGKVTPGIIDFILSYESALCSKIGTYEKMTPFFMWCWNHIPSVLIMEEKSQSNIWILEKEISGEQSKSCLAKMGYHTFILVITNGCSPVKGVTSQTRTKGGINRYGGERLSLEGTGSGWLFGDVRLFSTRVVCGKCDADPQPMRANLPEPHRAAVRLYDLPH